MKKDLDYYLNLNYDILVRKIPKEEGGGYGAFMPDFKDVAFFYGDGESIEEAVKDLQEAFRATLKSMIEDKEPIPEPKDKDKSVRLNITLPQRIVDVIDNKARDMSMNRSSLIADLARKAFM